MKIKPTNLMQIRQMGLEVLNRELGPVLMIRFLQQFELGQGDYSTERHQWLKNMTVSDVVDQIHSEKEQEHTNINNS